MNSHSSLTTVHRQDYLSPSDYLTEPGSPAAIAAPSVWGSVSSLGMFSLRCLSEDKDKEASWGTREHDQKIYIYI